MYWTLVHWTNRETYYYTLTGDEEPKTEDLEAWAKDNIDFNPDEDEQVWIEPAGEPIPTTEITSKERK